MQTIFRLLKLKGANITASDEHCRRISPVDNADPSRQHLNFEFAYSLTEERNFKEKTLLERLEKIEKEHEIVAPRKDSVKLIEFMFAAPSELFDMNTIEQELKPGKGKGPSSINTPLYRFCEANNEFLRDEFGRDNIVGMQVHLDETTPHIHAWVMPVHKKKYNAKHFTGGRKAIQAMQDRYHSHMLKWMPEIAWERGQRKEITGRKHTTVKDWYGKQSLDEKKRAEINDLGIGKEIDAAIKNAVETAIIEAKQRKGLLVGTGKGAAAAMADLHNHPVRPLKQSPPVSDQAEQPPKQRRSRGMSR